MKPSNFGFNSDTATDNAFQKKVNYENPNKLAIAEHEAFVKELDKHNIEYLILEDSAIPIKPDAIFLNNWFTVLPNKQLYIFPMFSKSRQPEVNDEHVDKITSRFGIKERIDLRSNQQQYLEGTGSLIFDHPSKQVFASISQRTSPTLLSEFEKLTGYSIIAFDTEDLMGRPIYHTNVLLSIGANIIVVCYDCISNSIENAIVKQKLEALGRTIIEINFEQMNNFCANVFEVNDKEGNAVLCMSETAFTNFSKIQIEKISSKVRILKTSIPTIETLGGGSLRCMIAAGI